MIVVSESAAELGKLAGNVAGNIIRAAIRKNGVANIILATGASQFETLEQLISEPGIEWNKCVMFHLDEYIGLPSSHPASFRKYLQDRVLTKLPPLKASWLVNGEADPETECKRLEAAIRAVQIDLALVGIGENGHLAFNDPPADFDTGSAFIIVTLDEPCRRQQLGEGWFADLDEVPLTAISMSVHQIMKSRTILCSVPDKRKAIAVKNSLESQVSNLFPASILQMHGDCRFYLDTESASLLSIKVQ